MTKMMIVCLPDDVAADLTEMSEFTERSTEDILRIALRSAYVDFLEEKHADARHRLRCDAGIIYEILNNDDGLDDELPF